MYLPSCKITELQSYRPHWHGGMRVQKQEHKWSTFCKWEQFLLVRSLTDMHFLRNIVQFIEICQHCYIENHYITELKTLDAFQSRATEKCEITSQFGGKFREPWLLEDLISKYLYCLSVNNNRRSSISELGKTCQRTSRIRELDKTYYKIVDMHFIVWLKKTLDKKSKWK